MVKTKVINSCLNPVWNEEHSLSLTEPVGVLSLVCLCSDTRCILFLMIYVIYIYQSEVGI